VREITFDAKSFQDHGGNRLGESLNAERVESLECRPPILQWTDGMPNLLLLRTECRQLCTIKIPTNVESFTRGNKYKLIKDSFRLDIRKYSFSSRIVNIWNSLPNQVVDVNSC